MRILHLTDFHFNEGWFAWLANQAPPCDLICYTGDFLDIFSPVPASIQTQKVTQWISRVAPPFLFCSGNHDVEAKGARDGAWLKDLVSTHRWGDGTRLMRDCSAFLSSGWGTACRSDRPVNVLLRHAPPGDCATALSSITHSEWGDFGLGEDLRAGVIKADIVLSGHVHNPQGWHDRCGPAWSFNPGISSAGNVPNYILLDLTRRRAQWYVDNEPVDACYW